MVERLQSRCPVIQLRAVVLLVRRLVWSAAPAAVAAVAAMAVVDADAVGCRLRLHHLNVGVRANRWNTVLHHHSRLTSVRRAAPVRNQASKATAHRRVSN